MNKRIFICHYHFKRGGVAQVVKTFINLFYNEYELFLVSNGENDYLKNEILEKKVYEIIIPEIGYNEDVTFSNCENLLKEIENKFNELDIKKEDIFIFHNYHLGKNPAFTKFIVDFSLKNENKIYLYTHDFPEEGRWYNLEYLNNTIGENLYLKKHNVCYITINKFAYSILKSVIGDNVFYVPNSVDLKFKLTDINLSEAKEYLADIAKKENFNFDLKKKIFLYPVRTIRRKNVYEAILLAKIYDANLIVTLPSNSSSEENYDKRIFNFIKENKLNVLYGLGVKYPNFLEQSYRAADLVLSTSILEGFGLAFIEATYLQKRLLSRKICVLDDLNLKPDFYYNSIKTSLENKGEILETINNICNRITPLQFLKELLINQLNNNIIFDYSFLNLENQEKVIIEPDKYIHQTELEKIKKKIENLLFLHETVSNGIDLTKFTKEQYYMNLKKILNSKNEYSKDPTIISFKQVAEKIININLFRPILFYR